MKRMNTSMGKLLMLAFFSTLSIFSVYSENIRGRTSAILQIDGSAVSFKPEELIVIANTDEFSTFQEGIEIQIEIPSLLRSFRNSFALMMYKDITPDPNENQNEYSGTRIHMELIPARERTFVRIPLSETHEITGDALSSVLPIPVDAEQFPLLATVWPIMKGIPDAAFSEEFIITVVPIWKNEGSLTVNITNLSENSEETIEVTLDREAIELNKAIRLSAGIHKLRVASTQAPAIEQTIAVEPGEELTLDLALDYRPPELTIHIPRDTIIRLDGELIETDDIVKVIETEPGDHSITYTFGELEVSRSFTVQPGSRLNISLLIDVEIAESSDSGGKKYGKDGG